MNNRRLWNSHQTHKFLRAEASRESQNWCFQRFSRNIFHRLHHVDLSEYMQDWEQCRQNVPCVPRDRFKCLRDLNLLEYAQFTECHSKLGNGCFTILFDGAYFLLAVMVEGDESSQLKRANQQAVLAGYRLLLTALEKGSKLLTSEINLPFLDLFA